MPEPALIQLLTKARADVGRSRREGKLPHLDIGELAKNSGLAPAKLDGQLATILERADEILARPTLRAVPLLMIDGLLGSGVATLGALLRLLSLTETPEGELRDPDWFPLLLDSMSVFKPEQIHSQAEATHVPKSAMAILASRFPVPKAAARRPSRPTSFRPSSPPPMYHRETEGSHRRALPAKAAPAKKRR